jgi:oxaloacetate decarboxylase alpha subunit
MLSSDRGREMQSWEPPQPTIRELKRQYGDAGISDEELLRRYLVPLQDVEATRAAGPAATTNRFEHDDVPGGLVDELLAGTRASFAHLETRDASITVRR